jgi:hypothetical protein
VGLLPLNVGANGSVEKRPAGPGEHASKMEDEAVELVLAIGGDEGFSDCDLGLWHLCSDSQRLCRQKKKKKNRE